MKIIRTPDTFVKTYLGDLAYATESMPFIQWAAVRKIIDFYWVNGDIPDDKLMRRFCGFSPKQWADMKEDVMDAFFIYKQRSKMDEVMLAAAQMTELNRQKGLKSGQARMQRQLAELGIQPGEVEKPGLNQTETETETEQKEGIAAAALTPKAQTYPDRAEHVNEGLNGRPVELHEGVRPGIGRVVPLRARDPSRH
jgi:uncharacterized protein YdaU (DUF1376 family)